MQNEPKKPNGFGPSYIPKQPPPDRFQDSPSTLPFSVGQRTFSMAPYSDIVPPHESLVSDHQLRL